MAGLPCPLPLSRRCPPRLWAGDPDNEREGQPSYWPYPRATLMALDRTGRVSWPPPTVLGPLLCPHLPVLVHNAQESWVNAPGAPGLAVLPHPFPLPGIPCLCASPSGKPPWNPRQLTPLLLEALATPAQTSTAVAAGSLSHQATSAWRAGTVPAPPPHPPTQSANLFTYQELHHCLCNKLCKGRSHSVLQRK